MNNLYNNDMLRELKNTTFFKETEKSNVKEFVFILSNGVYKVYIDTGKENIDELDFNLLIENNKELELALIQEINRIGVCPFNKKIGCYHKYELKSYCQDCEYINNGR